MRAIRWAASSLNELCINGLHEAATMTGWLLAPVTPRSSANKPNQVVVGAAHTHTLRTHTAHTHLVYAISVRLSVGCLCRSLLAY